MTIRRLSKRGPEWTYAQHFWLTSLLGLSGLFVFGVLLTWGTAVPTKTVDRSPPSPDRSMVEVILDPPTSRSLVPMPLRGN